MEQYKAFLKHHFEISPQLSGRSGRDSQITTDLIGENLGITEVKNELELQPLKGFTNY